MSSVAESPQWKKDGEIPHFKKRGARKGSISKRARPPRGHARLGSEAAAATRELSFDGEFAVKRIDG